jgi:signal transduction histidine kinase
MVVRRPRSDPDRFLRWSGHARRSLLPPAAVIDPSALLPIYRSHEPTAIFRAVVDVVSATVPLRCALFLDSRDRSVRNAWPAETQLTDDLVDTVLHIIRPEVYPLGSEFPFDASRFPASDMLLLPVHHDGEKVAVCVLVAESGAFGEDVQPWVTLSASITDAEARCRHLSELEERCEELRRRVEESEALHTLGLAVNRTLNKDEVLNLVARFTRNLLGAQYVTVNTMTDSRIYQVAAVGLREAGEGLEDYHLARAVVEAERPMVVGGPEANLQVEHFPFHRAQGMQAGLGIPLTLFGETFGALIVGYRTPCSFSPHDTRLALTLAGHAAVAISNARLHESVEQRSRDLELAYAELNELTRSKERFFASINHELRNPLAAVLGYQSLLLDDEAASLPEKAERYLRKAHQSAGTLRVLVDDLLDLSKLAAGKVVLDCRECSVGDIVEASLVTMQPMADAQRVELAVELPDPPPVLLTDGHRVQQILVNLISNAVKFSPSEGKVRVVTEVVEALVPSDPPADGTDPAPASWVEIRVIDTGPGIVPEDLPRIFEEFEQVKGTTGGTGLGLPIARRLARLLEGELDATSEVGVGSTFVLRLPASLPLEDAGTLQVGEPEVSHS